MNHELREVVPSNFHLASGDAPFPSPAPPLRAFDVVVDARGVGAFPDELQRRVPRMEDHMNEPTQHAASELDEVIAWRAKREMHATATANVAAATTRCARSGIEGATHPNPYDLALLDAEIALREATGELSTTERAADTVITGSQIAAGDVGAIACKPESIIAVLDGFRAREAQDPSSLKPMGERDAFVRTLRPQAAALNARRKAAGLPRSAVASAILAVDDGRLDARLRQLSSPAPSTEDSTLARLREQQRQLRIALERQAQQNEAGKREHAKEQEHHRHQLAAEERARKAAHDAGDRKRTEEDTLEAAFIARQGATP